jgi:hypothetical protein
MPALMKTFLILIVAFWSLNAGAQNQKSIDIPPPVMEAFKKDFPTATAVKWEKEKGSYEAEFKMKQPFELHGKISKQLVEKSAVYHPSGKLVQTETEIAPGDLPAAVSDYISKNMSGKKIKEASKITDANGRDSFEAEINGTDYIFDGTGNLIRKENADKGDDKD